MARITSFKNNSFDDQLENLLNEIRIYSIDKATIDDSLKIAYEYINKLDLLGKIDNAEEIIEVIESRFTDTQEIVDFVLNENVISWVC